MKITKKQLKQIIKEEISKMQEAREFGFFDKVGSVLRGQDPTLAQTQVEGFHNMYNDTFMPALEKAKMLRDKLYFEDMEPAKALKLARRAKDIAEKALDSLMANYGKTEESRKYLGKKELQMFDTMNNKLYKMYEDIEEIIKDL